MTEQRRYVAGDRIAAAAPVYVDADGLVRAGRRFGMTAAEAEAGARDAVEKILPVGFDSTWFDAPTFVDTEFQSLFDQHVRAVRDRRDRWDRQAAFLLFGVHF